MKIGRASNVMGLLDLSAEVLQGSTSTPRLTFGECLQELVLKKRFPDDCEQLRPIMRMARPDLGPTFTTIVSKHLQELVHPFLQDFRIECTASVVTDVWTKTKKLLQTFVDISGLENGVEPALEKFLLSLTRLAPHLWRVGIIEDYEVYLAFDETLLALLKSLISECGVTALQTWRARFTHERLEVDGMTYDCQAILVRSMQYATDVSVKHTTMTVTARVCEGRLPNELVDLVSEALLQDRGISMMDDWNGLWAPVPWFKTEEARLIGHTCNCHLASCPEVNGTGMTRHWSVRERRYLRFHSVMGYQLEAGGIDMRGFVCVSEVWMPNCNAFKLLCGDQFPESRGVNANMVYGGLNPGMIQFDDYYYEADHGIEREWRIEMEVEREDDIVMDDDHA